MTEPLVSSVCFSWRTIAPFEVVPTYIVFEVPSIVDVPSVTFKLISSYPLVGIYGAVVFEYV